MTAGGATMTEQQKRSWRRIGWISAAALVLVVGVAVVLNLSHVEASQGSGDEAKTAEGADKEKDPVPVKVTPVVTGPVAGYISATANLVAENEVKVLAEAEGRVTELKVEEGDSVATGQLLAALNRDEATIAANKSRLRGLQRLPRLPAGRRDDGPGAHQPGGVSTGSRSSTRWPSRSRPRRSGGSVGPRSAPPSQVG